MSDNQIKHRRLEASATKSSIPFRGFDERGEVRIYGNGILPHWRQDNCSYFVTFRQADSMPTSVLREIEYERQQWLQRHGIDPNSSQWKVDLAKLSATVRREYEKRLGVLLDKHLDAGHGSCALRNAAVAKIVTDALHHFHGERVYCGDFIVMPNHVHWLVRPHPTHELEDILHSIKSFTANKINRVLGQSGSFWQRDSYDHILRDFDQLEAYRQYIVANPIKANLRDDQFARYEANWHPDE